MVPKHPCKRAFPNASNFSNGSNTGSWGPILILRRRMPRAPKDAVPTPILTPSKKGPPSSLSAPALPGNWRHNHLAYVCILRPWQDNWQGNLVVPVSTSAEKRGNDPCGLQVIFWRTDIFWGGSQNPNWKPKTANGKLYCLAREIH